MKYLVIVQRLARRDLVEAYRWAARRAPYTARRWLERFEAKIGTLSSRPQRCGPAPESQFAGEDLRQLLFGRKPNVFRAIFVIDESAVRVVRVVRAQRRFLTRRQIEEAIKPDEDD